MTMSERSLRMSDEEKKVMLLPIEDKPSAGKKILLLPIKGNPSVINFSDMDKYLTNNKIMCKVIVWLNVFGYRLNIFYNDGTKNLNEIATKIAGINMYGDCILWDDRKDLDNDKLALIIDRGERSNKKELISYINSNAIAEFDGDELDIL